MEIPQHIFDKIMLFNSHPTADIMRQVINKYDEIMAMRHKNKYAYHLTFYKTWCNCELDQVKIDKTREILKEIIFNNIEFDF